MGELKKSGRSIMIILKKLWQELSRESPLRGGPGDDSHLSSLQLAFVPRGRAAAGAPVGPLPALPPQAGRPSPASPACPIGSPRLQASALPLCGGLLQLCFTLTPSSAPDLPRSLCILGAPWALWKTHLPHLPHSQEPPSYPGTKGRERGPALILLSFLASFQQTSPSPTLLDFKHVPRPFPPLCPVSSVPKTTQQPCVHSLLWVLPIKGSRIIILKRLCTMTFKPYNPADQVLPS